MAQKTVPVSIVAVVVCVLVIAGVVLHATVGQGASRMQFEQAWDSEVWKLFENGAASEDIINAIESSERDTHEINEFGTPLLLVAIRYQRDDVVPWLLENGLSPDGLNRDGMPLMYAIRFDCEACARSLLTFGADPHITAFSPIQFAEESRSQKYLDLLSNWQR